MSAMSVVAKYKTDSRKQLHVHLYAITCIFSHKILACFWATVNNDWVSHSAMRYTTILTHRPRSMQALLPVILGAEHTQTAGDLASSGETPNPTLLRHAEIITEFLVDDDRLWCYFHTSHTWLPWFTERRINVVTDKIPVRLKFLIWREVLTTLPT